LNRRQFLASLGLCGLSGSLMGAFADEARGENLFRFAHITDLHMTSREQGRYPGAHRHVALLVDQLNEEDLDFVLFTGDMIHFVSDLDTELGALRAALGRLRHPYYCAFGNHDVEGTALNARKRLWMERLGDSGLALGDASYSIALPGGVRLVVLDTTDVDGNAYHTWHGCLGDRQLAWLKQCLRSARDETIFLALHHPPTVPWPGMDALAMETRSAQALAGILKDHATVQVILGGHYHVGLSREWCSATLLCGPSLVEHPHAWRLLTVERLGARAGLVRHEWRYLPMDPDHHLACAIGPAGWRGWGLHALSQVADSQCVITLPT
jgi:3',5'-cyclic AMP phosphodiesterase CpdA